MNLSSISRMTGIIWLGLSLLLIAYSLIAVPLDQVSFTDIFFELVAGFTLFILCLVLIKKNSGNVRHLTPREAILIVILAWVGMVIVGSLPYLFHPRLAIDPVDAIFESASGFSTTGATIFTDIESLPKSILFWRSLKQWFGGMGVIVLFVSIMPALGFAGKNLFKNEAPGPVTESMTPHIRDTSRYLWLIYSGTTVIAIFVFYLEGMKFFEAVCHGLTTIATGGFSTKNTSVQAFSPLIQWTMIFFMIIMGINFNLYLAVFYKRGRIALSDPELRWYLTFIFTLGLIFTVVLMSKNDYSLERGLRSGFFTVVSLVTTSGFANDDYETFPLALQALVLIVLFTGGSAGSTSGGLKFYRIVLLFRTISNEIRLSLRPGIVLGVKMGEGSISENLIKRVFVVICIYFLTVGAGALLLFVAGLDPLTAFSAMATSVGNFGPGLGTVGPSENFAHFNDFSKITCSVAMIMGRLEFLPFFALFHPAFWRK